MSHIVQIQTEVRDPTAIACACTRLQLPPPAQGTFQLFGTEVTGLGVQLPGWRFPAVCNTATGEVQFDNFEGRWGERAELDRFLQAYAIEVTKIEARKKGHTVTEQPLQDGSIKLTINLGGTA